MKNMPSNVLPSYGFVTSRFTATPFRVHPTICPTLHRKGCIKVRPTVSIKSGTKLSETKHKIIKEGLNMKICTRWISRLAFLFAAILYILQGNCLAQTKAQKIDALMNTYYQYGQFNGSVLVAEHGKIIYKKGLVWRIWNGIFPIYRIPNSGLVRSPNSSLPC